MRQTYTEKLSVMLKEAVRFNFDKFTINSDIEHDEPKIKTMLRLLDTQMDAASMEITGITYRGKEATVSYGSKRRTKDKRTFRIELMKTKARIYGHDVNYNNPADGIKKVVKSCANNGFGDDTMGKVASKRDKSNSWIARIVEKDKNAIKRKLELEKVIGKAKYFKDRAGKKYLIAGDFELVANLSGSRDSFMRIESRLRGDLVMTADFQMIGHGYFSSGISPSELSKEIKTREKMLEEMKKITIEGAGLFNQINSIFKKYPLVSKEI